MIRRDLLKSVAMLALLPMLHPLASWAAPAVSGSRVRPGDPGWPNEFDWAGLRDQLSGTLIKPQALLNDCIRATAQGPACQAVLKVLGNPYYIGDQPGGTQVSGWYKAWTPAPSAYAIRAENAADVLAGVNFARDHNLRLVIKGGGHSYQGTSNAPDSLLLWTRSMRNIKLHDAFIPQDCSGLVAPSHAVTVAAGALWMDVYDVVTTKAGRYVQGGGCATVGVAGLVQSGGFGSFSKKFGTAAGSLLEAEVVTADGQIRTVNAHRDADLFWALKGGGGGSFGAVTSLTLATHELPEFFGSANAIIKARSEDDFRTLLRRFFDFYAASLFNSNWGESVTIGKDNSLKISMVCQGLDDQTAQLVWAPFMAMIEATPKAFRVHEELAAGSIPARAWWDIALRKSHGSTSIVFDNRSGAEPLHAWWRGDQEQVGAYLHGYDSLWLPAGLLDEPQRFQLVEACFAASRQTSFALHFNKGLAGAPGDAIARAEATATNPAVLEAFALMIAVTGGAPQYPGSPNHKLDDDQAAANAAAVGKAIDCLRPLVPSGGSYISESDYFNDAWQSAFWGNNYSRLSQLKNMYDPNGLFIVHHGVGSEKWSADGFTRLN